MPDRRIVAKSKHSGPTRIHRDARARSRITNGSALLPHVDGRTLWVRRFKDLFGLHVADLGGDAAISEAEKSLARRAAAMTVELERMEMRFAQDNETSPDALQLYSRISNTLRRLHESLGLQRRSKQINPPTLQQYLRQRHNGSNQIIDAEADE